MNTVTPFLRQSRATPNAIAVIQEDVALTYAELRVYTGCVAHWLRKAGVQRGDLVGLIAANPLQQIIVLLACARFGAAAAPLTGSQELMASAAVRIGLTASVTCAEAAPELPSVPASRRLQFASLYRPVPDAERVVHLDEDVGELLWRICFSSGTTGEPKAIGWTHRSSLNNSIQSQSMFPSGAGERALVASGSALNSSSNNYMRVLHSGGTVIMATGAQLTPAAVIDLLQRHRVTQLFTSSHIVSTLAEHVTRTQPGGGRVTPDSLKLICCGGSGIKPAAQEILKTRFAARLYINYGSSEAGLAAVSDALTQAESPELAGRLPQWAMLQIVDDQDRSLPDGTQGRVRYRGPEISAGYFGDDAANARFFKDGWFYPGDLGLITPRGFLQLAGREDERLNLGGHKVNPLAVENVLNEHPGVLESALVATEIADGIEGLVALVVPRENVSLEHITPDLIAACKRKLKSDDVPLKFLLVERLPRNEAGKLVRQKLGLILKRASSNMLQE